jgi:hypothetical protein
MLFQFGRSQPQLRDSTAQTSGAKDYPQRSGRQMSRDGHAVTRDDPWAANATHASYLPDRRYEAPGTLVIRRGRAVSASPGAMP